jgi:mannose-6-phosphate isomerase-like protein (cupin superfamily)
MAGYTIKNLKEEVEDAAPKFGLSPNLEARFAREALESEGTGVSYQRLAPNARIPFGHKHERQEEVYVIVGGSGRVKLEDEVVDVRQWDAVRVGPDVTRCFEAGPDGVEFVAFGAPTSETSDVQMISDWWAD